METFQNYALAFAKVENIYDEIYVNIFYLYYLGKNQVLWSHWLRLEILKTYATANIYSVDRYVIFLLVNVL